MTSYQRLPPRILQSLRQNRRARRKGGRVHKVTYPWITKGRKSIKRRRTRV